MATEKPGAPPTSPIRAGKLPCIHRPQPEPTESVTLRLVFGYIRMEEPGEAEIARLRAELASFCLGHGFHLGGVFCDRGVAEDAIARVGFAGALDALRVPESYALLVPSREHFVRTGASGTGLGAHGEPDGMPGAGLACRSRLGCRGELT